MATFGLCTKSESYLTDIESLAEACKWTAPEDGNVSKITVHLKCTTSNKRSIMAAYADSAGSVGPKIATSNVVTTIANVAYQEIDFTIAFAITNGIVYWFAINGEAGGGVHWIGGQVGSTNQAYEAGRGYDGTMPDTLPAGDYWDGELDFCVTYTPTAVAEAPIGDSITFAT